MPASSSGQGLPKSRLYGYGGVPNQVKPVVAYFHKKEKAANIHALDDSIGQPISHISEKLERQFVRLSVRETSVAHLARERTTAFLRLNTQPSEAHMFTTSQSEAARRRESLFKSSAAIMEAASALSFLAEILTPEAGADKLDLSAIERDGLACNLKIIANSIYENLDYVPDSEASFKGLLYTGGNNNA